MRCRIRRIDACLCDRSVVDYVVGCTDRRPEPNKICELYCVAVVISFEVIEELRTFGSRQSLQLLPSRLDRFHFRILQSLSQDSTQCVELNEAGGIHETSQGNKRTEPPFLCLKIKSSSHVKLHSSHLHSQGSNL